MIKRGPFKVVKSKQVYKNNWINVREDQIVEDSGKKGIFGVVEAGPGVSILAIDSENKVFLLKKYQYASDKIEHELPSGGVDRGEAALDAGRRELREETGLTAKKWTDFGVINQFTTVFKAPNYIFLAEDLKEGEVQDDEKTIVSREKIPFKEVLKLVNVGKITHSPTVVAVLKAARLKEI